MGIYKFFTTPTTNTRIERLKTVALTGLAGIVFGLGAGWFLHITMVNDATATAKAQTVQVVSKEAK